MTSDWMTHDFSAIQDALASEIRRMYEADQTPRSWHTRA